MLGLESLINSPSSYQHMVCLERWKAQAVAMSFGCGMSMCLHCLQLS